MLEFVNNILNLIQQDMGAVTIVSLLFLVAAIQTLIIMKLFGSNKSLHEQNKFNRQYLNERTEKFDIVVDNYYKSFLTMSESLKGLEIVLTEIKTSLMYTDKDKEIEKKSKDK